MGGGLAIDPPVAAAIGLKPGMPDTRRRLPGDPRAARRPGLIQLDRVTDHPGLAVLGSGGASAEVIATAGRPEPGNLESSLASRCCQAAVTGSALKGIPHDSVRDLPLGAVLVPGSARCRSIAPLVVRSVIHDRDGQKAARRAVSGEPRVPRCPGRPRTWDGSGSTGPRPQFAGSPGEGRQRRPRRYAACWRPGVSRHRGNPTFHKVSTSDSGVRNRRARRRFHGLEVRG